MRCFVSKRDEQTQQCPRADSRQEGNFLLPILRVVRTQCQLSMAPSLIATCAVNTYGISNTRTQPPSHASEQLLTNPDGRGGGGGGGSEGDGGGGQTRHLNLTGIENKTQQYKKTSL